MSDLSSAIVFAGYSSSSKIRLLFDISILVMYAYLVFAVPSLSSVLFGLFFVSVLYVITGIVRTVEWNDRKVSKLMLSGVLATAYFLEWVFSSGGPLSNLSLSLFPEDILSWILVALALFMLLFYRFLRGREGYPPIVPIGIDIDGVLGEQVPPVLDRLQRKGIGLGVSKDKISSWNFPIDGTSISKEIENAMLDAEYIREMPVVSGSTTVMRELAKRFHVIIASSRPTQAEMETVKWLHGNFKNCYNEYVNTREIGKESLGLKVLVDDYVENVKRFGSESGIALLFSQPWNLDEDDQMKELMRNGKVIRCNGWKEVESNLQSIQDRS